VITFPVCENLMNGAAMGLALAGYRPVVIHERMDFLAVGMDPLVNHIPVWPARAPMSLPLVVFAVVGKGKGQGPQHSKNLAPGSKCSKAGRWSSRARQTARTRELVAAIFGDRPVMYVAHREFFNDQGASTPPRPGRIGLCGASKRHEEAFYR
jgi:pyruvate/2-oxoglutarate/acetoin dehydrogenase E1 component